MHCPALHVKNGFVWSQIDKNVYFKHGYEVISLLMCIHRLTWISMLLMQKLSKIANVIDILIFLTITYLKKIWISNWKTVLTLSLIYAKWIVWLRGEISNLKEREFLNNCIGMDSASLRITVEVYVSNQNDHLMY